MSKQKFYEVFDDKRHQVFEIRALEIRPLPDDDNVATTSWYEIELGNGLAPATLSVPKGFAVRLMA